MPTTHHEMHRVERIGWLRAAVLGANDGILSTASLIVGVAAAQPERSAILLSGIAGLVAGAMSMAAGEFVSVSSQADAESADRLREAEELVVDPAGEEEELAGIYRERGLDPALAAQVARQLTAHDPLAAHLRDELGITDHGAARPVQAAMASAASFAIGAVVPLATVIVAPHASLAIWVPAVTILCLALLGMVGARAGGSPVLKPTVRVVFWGAMAMAVTFAIGRAVGTTL
jgi:VIT1/CCC1 family predicted Fe2+/Mn2+ transporter